MAGWGDVTPGVLQGMVLARCLFMIFMDNLVSESDKLWLEVFTTKFPDDTKGQKRIRNSVDRRSAVAENKKKICPFAIL
jgi:hypothetical protein